MIRNIIISLLAISLITLTCTAVTSGIEIELRQLKVYQQFTKLNPIIEKHFFDLHTDGTANSKIYCAEYSTKGGLTYDDLKQSIAGIKATIDDYIETLKKYKPIFDSFSRVIVYDAANTDYSQNCINLKDEIINLNDAKPADTTATSELARLIREQTISCANFLRDYFFEHKDVREGLYKMIYGEGTYDENDANINKILKRLSNEFINKESNLVKLVAKDALEILKDIKNVAVTKLYQTKIFNMIIDAERDIKDADRKGISNDKIMQELRNPYIGYTFINKCGKKEDPVFLKFYGSKNSGNLLAEKVESKDIQMSPQITINFKIANFIDLVYHFRDYHLMEGCKDDSNSKAYCDGLEEISKNMRTRLFEIGSILKDKFDKEKLNTLRNNIIKNGFGRNNVKKEELDVIPGVFNEIFIRNAKNWKICPKMNNVEAFTKEVIKNIAEVVGFTTMVTGYAFDIFLGPDPNDTSENLIAKREKQLDKFWHGPKMGVKFMNRNGFYALYKGMSTCGQELFKYFVGNVMCTTDVCSRMRLVTHRYRNNEIPGLVASALTFRDWLSSIYTVNTTDQRIVCSLKSELPEEREKNGKVSIKIPEFKDYFDCEYSDKLSPPNDMIAPVIESEIRKYVFDEFAADSKLTNQYLKMKMEGVYGMGAYVKNTEGNMLVEIRTTTRKSLEVDYSNIDDFMEDVLGSFIKNKLKDESQPKNEFFVKWDPENDQNYDSDEDDEDDDFDINIARPTRMRLTRPIIKESLSTLVDTGNINELVVPNVRIRRADDRDTNYQPSQTQSRTGMINLRLNEGLGRDVNNFASNSQIPNSGYYSARGQTEFMSSDYVPNTVRESTHRTRRTDFETARSYNRVNVAMSMLGNSSTSNPYSQSFQPTYGTSTYQPTYSTSPYQPSYSTSTYQPSYSTSTYQPSPTYQPYTGTSGYSMSGGYNAYPPTLGQIPNSYGNQQQQDYYGNNFNSNIRRGFMLI